MMVHGSGSTPARIITREVCSSPPGPPPLPSSATARWLATFILPTLDSSDACSFSMWRTRWCWWPAQGRRAHHLSAGDGRAGGGGGREGGTGLRGREGPGTSGSRKIALPRPPPIPPSPLPAPCLTPAPPSQDLCPIRGCTSQFSPPSFYPPHPPPRLSLLHAGACTRTCFTSRHYARALRHWGAPAATSILSATFSLQDDAREDALH